MGHYNALTKTSTQCKVCNSKFRKDIERLHSEGKKPFQIQIFLEDKDKNHNISRQSIRKHCKNHTFQIDKKIITFQDVKKKSDDKKQEASENNLSEEHLKGLNQFLDLVIDKVNTAVKDNKIKPTVSEGIKAAEIKAKIKEDSKFEKELVKFFTEVSTKHA